MTEPVRQMVGSHMTCQACGNPIAYANGLRLGHLAGSDDPRVHSMCLWLGIGLTDRVDTLDAEAGARDWMWLVGKYGPPGWRSMEILPPDLHDWVRWMAPPDWSAVPQ